MSDSDIIATTAFEEIKYDTEDDTEKPETKETEDTDKISITEKAIDKFIKTQNKKKKQKKFLTKYHLKMMQMDANKALKKFKEYQSPRHPLLKIVDYYFKLPRTGVQYLVALFIFILFLILFFYVFNIVKKKIIGKKTPKIIKKKLPTKKTKKILIIILLISLIMFFLPYTWHWVMDRNEKYIVERLAKDGGYDTYLQKKKEEQKKKEAEKRIRRRLGDIHADEESD